MFQGQTVVEICSHHLHTGAVAPSVRLALSFPRGLEDLILSCLEKEPGQRPPNARAFLERLAACGDVGRWGEAEARAWWAAHGAPALARRNESAEDGLASAPLLSLPLETLPSVASVTVPTRIKAAREDADSLVARLAFPAVGNWGGGVS